MYDLTIFLDNPLQTTLATALAALGAYFAAYCVYQIYFSPLSRLPGPWHTAVTNLWINSHVIRMQKSAAIHQLFARYGPVVRIGPGKVAFRDYAAMKDVYTTHKFDKSVYYETFLLDNAYHTFVLRDDAAHAAHRKKFAAHFTPSNTNAFQPEIYDLVYQLIDGIYGYAEQDAPIDCLAMIRHLMIDILAESAFGAQAASLRKWAAGEEDPLAVAVHDFPPLGVIRYLLPGWIWSGVCRIPIARVQQFCSADKIMAKFVVARLEEVRSALSAGKVDAAEKWMAVRLLAEEKSPAGMTHTEIKSEVTGHIIAAADTSSITVGYGLWVLSQRADIMQRLRHEIDQAMPDSRTPPGISILQDLPYLNAFIKETLRVYGPVPSILEREVRAQKSAEQPFNLMGYNLPAGTVVGTQGWSVHRDPQVFPDPLAFTPERWLQTEDNAAALARMNQNFVAFGLGSRVCIGQRMATMIIRVAVASIVRNFDIVASPETTQRSMKPTESFVIFPASMECKLRFVPRA